MASADRGRRFAGRDRDLPDRGGTSPDAGAPATPARPCASAAADASADLWVPSPGVSLRAFFLPLACVRLVAAFLNIIHDCDETFNYWEPLHFLMHGFGLETWEYSSEFALRSWWYLLLHYAVAQPVRKVVEWWSEAGPDGLPSSPSGAWLGGSGSLLVAFLLPSARAVPFFAVRVVLALAASYAEARLCRAVSSRVSRRVGAYALLFCVFSAGGFAASPALLPSSFAMVCLAWATACAVEGNLPPVVALAAVGIVWGWSVVAVATVPLALWTLLRWRPLYAAFLYALAVLALVCVPLALADAFFYGRTTVSQLNFLAYNVVGGGDSALYGTESKTYYVINGLLGFQGGFVLFALALPLLKVRLALQALRQRTASKGGAPGAAPLTPPLLMRLGTLVFLVALPAALWFAAVSALPHKEERFLFVIYPLMAVCAGAGLLLVQEIALKTLSGVAKLARAIAGRSRSAASRAPRWPARLAAAGAALCILLQALLALSRTAALLANYGAPMRIYASLPYEARSSLPATPSPGSADAGASLPGSSRSRSPFSHAHFSLPAVVSHEIHASLHPRSLVCLGAEWHRFPASFFLPSTDYRVAFVASGFDGLLPRPFAEAREALPPKSFRDLVPATSAAPPSFNDRNRWQPEHALRDAAACSYFVTIEETKADGTTMLLDDAALASTRGAWRELAALPFVVGGGAEPTPEAGRLASLFRALYVPGKRVGAGINWQRYVLLERTRGEAEPQHAHDSPAGARATPPDEVMTATEPEGPAARDAAEPPSDGGARSHAQSVPDASHDEL